MKALFLNILNLSINASWLILIVMIVRLLLKKAPKWISCLLWGMVALRLLCPVSLESALSLLPSGKVIPGNIETVQDPHIDSGVRIIDNAVNPVIERSFSPNIESSVNPMQVVLYVARVIWLVGMAVMLVYALGSLFLLKRKVRASVAIGDRVQECDEVRSPFILGIFRPVIYVPSGMNGKTLELVIAHEEAHLKRRDHWWKPFGFGLLAVYWFNPLCWVAYVLLCRDIEAACDEKVISDKDREYMAAYSKALLDCSINRRFITACPLAFGEAGVKERIRGVLNYKKPAFWVIIVAVIACVALGVCFMTNPKSNQKKTAIPIGDIVTGPVMLMAPAYVPYLQEVDTETEEVLLNAFKAAQWEEVSEDSQIPDGEAYSVFIYNGGTPYRLVFYADYTVDCEHDNEIRRYVLSDHNIDVLVANLANPENDDEIADSLIFCEPENITNEGVWECYAKVKEISIAGGDQEAPDDSETVHGIRLFSSDVESENSSVNAAYEASENMGVEYYYDGVYYVVDGDMVFQYKKELIGRSPGAVCDTRFIVLTNDPDITFEKVNRIIYSSASSDWLFDTIIIGMHAIDEKGNGSIRD